MLLGGDAVRCAISDQIGSCGAVHGLGQAALR